MQNYHKSARTAYLSAPNLQLNPDLQYPSPIQPHKCLTLQTSFTPNLHHTSIFLYLTPSKFIEKASARDF